MFFFKNNLIIDANRTNQNQRKRIGKKDFALKNNKNNVRRRNNATNINDNDDNDNYSNKNKENGK